MAKSKRVQRSHDQNVDFYKTGVRAQKPNESYDHYYRNLVDMANRRMRRLVEMEKNDPLYKGVTNFAYKKAVADIKALTGKEMKGFSVALPKTKTGEVDRRSADRRLNAVKQFLESATSTRGGINKVFQQRAKALNESMGTNFTWQEMVRFWNNERSQVEFKKMASSTFIKAMASIKKFTKPEEIQKVLDKDIQVNDDQIIDEVAKRLLKNGLTFKDLTK